MERRPYFIFGDVLATLVIGSASGFLAAALIGESWNMILAMVVAMVLGMVLALVVGFALFFWMFGAMEVMVPTMLTGMLAGMVVGMAAAMTYVSPGAGAWHGALIGVLTLVGVYAANATLSGRTTQWTS